MPLPVVLGAMAAGSVVSVGTGIAIDKLTGHKTTERDVVTYGLLGATPIGYASGIMKAGSRVHKNKKIYQIYTSDVGS